MRVLLEVRSCALPNEWSWPATPAPRQWTKPRKWNDKRERKGRQAGSELSGGLGRTQALVELADSRSAIRFSMVSIRLRYRIRTRPLKKKAMGRKAIKLVWEKLGPRLCMSAHKSTPERQRRYANGSQSPKGCSFVVSGFIATPLDCIGLTNDADRPRLHLGDELSRGSWTLRGIGRQCVGVRVERGVRQRSLIHRFTNRQVVAVWTWQDHP